MSVDRSGLFTLTSSRGHPTKETEGEHKCRYVRLMTVTLPSGYPMVLNTLTLNVR